MFNYIEAPTGSVQAERFQTLSCWIINLGLSLRSASWGRKCPHVQPQVPADEEHSCAASALNCGVQGQREVFHTRSTDSYPCNSFLSAGFSSRCMTDTFPTWARDFFCSPAVPLLSWLLWSEQATAFSSLNMPSHYFRVLCELFRLVSAVSTLFSSLVSHNALYRCIYDEIKL